MSSSLAAWLAAPSALAMTSSRSAASRSPSASVRARWSSSAPRPPGDGGRHVVHVPGNGLALLAGLLEVLAHRQEASALAGEGAGVGQGRVGPGRVDHVEIGHPRQQRPPNAVHLRPAAQAIELVAAPTGQVGAGEAALLQPAVVGPQPAVVREGVARHSRHLRAIGPAPAHHRRVDAGVAAEGRPVGAQDGPPEAEAGQHLWHLGEEQRLLRQERFDPHACRLFDGPQTVVEVTDDGLAAHRQREGLAVGAVHQLDGARLDGLGQAGHVLRPVAGHLLEGVAVDIETLCSDGRASARSMSNRPTRSQQYSYQKPPWGRASQSQKVMPP